MWEGFIIIYSKKIVSGIIIGRSKRQHEHVSLE